MKLFIRLEAPFEWVRLVGSKVEGFGEVPSLGDYPLSADYEVVGVVPGEWITSHRISLPARSRKQFQAAVPYALEESMSEDVDELHFVCTNWKVNEESTVLVVSRSKMREWQAAANEHALPVATLVPDHALIPLHDAAECTLSEIDDKLLVNHREGFGVSLDADFLDVWLMDMPISSTIAINEKELTERLIESHPDRDFRYWPFGNKMAHWLEYPQNTLHDLWTETYRPAVNRLGWRAFSVPLMVLAMGVMIKIGVDLYRYVALHAEVRSINDQMQDVVKSAFPEIDFVPVDNEHHLMQQALSRRGGAAVKQSVHTILAEAASVLRSERVSLDNMVYRNEELVISCLLNDFSQVDKLTRKLNARPSIQAVLQSSASDDGVILASFALRQG